LPSAARSQMAFNMHCASCTYFVALIGENFISSFYCNSPPYCLYHGTFLLCQALVSGKPLTVGTLFVSEHGLGVIFIILIIEAFIFLALAMYAFFFLPFGLEFAV